MRSGAALGRTGGAEAGRFVFSSGRDVVEDFGRGPDRIVLAERFGVSDLRPFIARPVPRDGGGSMLLEDMRLASLSASDFAFA